MKFIDCGANIEYTHMHQAFSDMDKEYNEAHKAYLQSSNILTKRREDDYSLARDANLKNLNKFRLTDVFKNWLGTDLSGEKQFQALMVHLCSRVWS